MSTLNKWITADRDTDVVLQEDLGLARENDRLRRETPPPGNRNAVSMRVGILKEEREILKKGNAVLREPKAVRFRFVPCPAGELKIR